MERNRHTALTPQEEDHFRDLLMSRAKELLNLDRDLEDEFAGFTVQGMGELSHIRFHGADIGSEDFYQEFVMRLAEKETHELQEIEDALQRLRDGTYGVCQECGADIKKERLDALPEVRTCISCQEELEADQRQRPRDPYAAENERDNYFRRSQGETPPPSSPPPAP